MASPEAASIAVSPRDSKMNGGSNPIPSALSRAFSASKRSAVLAPGVRLLPFRAAQSDKTLP